MIHHVTATCADLLLRIPWHTRVQQGDLLGPLLSTLPRHLAISYRSVITATTPCTQRPPSPASYPLCIATIVLSSSSTHRRINLHERNITVQGLHPSQLERSSGLVIHLPHPKREIWCPTSPRDDDRGTYSQAARQMYACDGSQIPVPLAWARSSVLSM